MVLPTVSLCAAKSHIADVWRVNMRRGGMYVSTRSRLRLIITAGVLIMVAYWVLYDDGRDGFADGVTLNAVYDEDARSITVAFSDGTEEATSSTLEILGMFSPYERTFSGYSFTEVVPFGDPPDSGWDAYSVVVSAEHPEHGSVMVSTGIHRAAEKPPAVAVSWP